MTKVPINKELITIVASNSSNSTTMFNDVKTKMVSTEIPTNKIFEITNVLRDEEIKSGREKRRERRKQKRK